MGHRSRGPLSPTRKGVLVAAGAAFFIGLLLGGYQLARGRLWPAPLADGRVRPVYQAARAKGVTIAYCGARGRTGPEQLTVEWTNTDAGPIVLDETFTLSQLIDGAYTPRQPTDGAAFVDRRHTLATGQRVRVTYDIARLFGPIEPGAYRLEASFAYREDAAAKSERRQMLLDFLVSGEGADPLYANYVFGDEVFVNYLSSFLPFYETLPFFHIGADVFCGTRDPYTRRPAYDICIERPQYQEVPFDPAIFDSGYMRWSIDKNAFLNQYSTWRRVDIHQADGGETACALLYGDEDVFFLRISGETAWYLIRLQPLADAPTPPRTAHESTGGTG